MKTYTVIRSSSGQVGCTVTDPRFGGARLVKHVVFHSPSGFETGYSGNGPADLALSILADHFEVSDKQIAEAIQHWRMREDGGQAERALLYHQQFKNRFIAARQLANGQSYEILGAEIASWLAEPLRDRAAAQEAVS